MLCIPFLTMKWRIYHQHLCLKNTQIHMPQHNQEKGESVVYDSIGWGATPPAFFQTHTPNLLTEVLQGSPGTHEILSIWAFQLIDSYTFFVFWLASGLLNALDAQLRPNSLCILAGTALFHSARRSRKYGRLLLVGLAEIKRVVPKFRRSYHPHRLTLSQLADGAALISTGRGVFIVLLADQLNSPSI